ncbi:MAG: hypothetical protein JRE16_08520 [Deltaproteobacteria bacterium]|jgi:hypothetical protein|nr:hypothetical protein [Deltaproteobacteria bacterium]MBW2519650.1 hypothetical protein [Deltaproteobacteria bacterium]
METRENKPNNKTGEDTGHESVNSDSVQPTEEHPDRFKETTEKLWDSTRQVWTTATFKAGQYKLLVQKKIDLSAVHKKISVAHGDLGRLIDDLRSQGKKNIMNLGEVKELLNQIDSLKATAAALEEEVETIKTAAPPPSGSQDTGQ